MSLAAPVLPTPWLTSGFFLVNKPEGPTSAGVTNRLKWLLKEHFGVGYKKVKIGHGGTLDPLACGLLPIGLGAGTKHLQALLDGPKTYAFTLRFGTATTTDDREGTVIATSPVRPTLTELLTLLPTFTGPITQTPPAFSALKVGGQRAYTLARAGTAVVLAPREVTIFSLALFSQSGANPANTANKTAPAPQNADNRQTIGTVATITDTVARINDTKTTPVDLSDNNYLTEVTLVAKVSKGTYIRTLAKDLALALGTVGHVTFLQRIQHGSFTLAAAVPYETLDKALQTGDWHSYLRPLAANLAGEIE